ncbi:MAG TPA: hypothetical protein VG028_21860 [Terriglobia bacterium]|nr:hypothetical protein [Terriglobia bacterium]
MSIKNPSALLVFLLLVSSASAQRPNALQSAPDKDPFVGTWMPNLEKSRPKPRIKEKSYPTTITREGDDLVVASAYESWSDRIPYKYKIHCDGRSHRISFGTLSCRYAASNTIEGETILWPSLSPGAPMIPLSGKPDYWTREVSDDGQEMAIFYFRDGARKKLASAFFWTRVK